MNTPLLESKDEKKIYKLDSNVEFALEIELRQHLKSKIIGQSVSTDKISSLIASRMYSLAPRKGPIAVIYLSGPTGVGKTETCHALAEYFFGDADAFVKINGEDYQDHHSSRNLFGAVKTYIGYGEPTSLNDISVYKGYNHAIESGELNSHIGGPKFKNFNIILIDEVEKMHPDIHQNFLGIFDKGEFQFPTGKEHRDESSHGEKTDFSQSIFILTSNIGERENTKVSIGFNTPLNERQENGKENINKAIREAFSPEFRGRITEFISYDPLERKNIEQICGVYLNRVSACLEEYGIRLDNAANIIPGLVNIFEKEKRSSEGARGLQKIVQNRFDGVLARIIHSGQLNSLSHGNIQIHASYEDDELQFFAEQIGEPGDIRLNQTFGDKIQENKKSSYQNHKERDILIHTYKRVSRSGYISSAINYTPFIDSLEKKLYEYGFNKQDIQGMDREIWEKVSRESEDYGPRQAKIQHTEEDLFYPFSLLEMKDLMLQLWKTQIESTHKQFKKSIVEFRLVLMQEVIRKTMIAFFGKNIHKDQSIWISAEIHQLYLQAKANLR